MMLATRRVLTERAMLMLALFCCWSALAPATVVRQRLLA